MAWLDEKWYEYFLIVFKFDPIWKSFYPSVSDSENIHYPYSDTKSCIFMMSISITIFFDTNIHYNLIGQKLTLSIYNSIFKQKYEKKYDINNIRPYSIRLHLYMTILNTTRRWYYGVGRSFWGGLALVRISKPLWRDNLVQMITYINEHFYYLWIGSRCTIDYAMSTN